MNDPICERPIELTIDALTLDALTVDALTLVALTIYERRRQSEVNSPPAGARIDL
jgi:hypothetical protein